MSEYKFRAWDDLNKKWLLGYNYGNLGGFSMMGEVMAFGEYTRMLNSFSIEDWHHIKLMLFSGYKDVEKKDIYVGDLFAGYNNEIKYFEVRFEKGEMCVYSNHGYWGSLKRFIEVLQQEKYDYKFKVIGNIYENPELLNN